MFIQIILDHIPKTWKAAAALVLSVIAYTIGLDGLTKIVLGKPGTVDLIKCLAGLLVGTIASVIFYREQHIRHEKSLEQVQVELLSQSGAQLKKPQPEATIKVWNLDIGEQPSTVEPKDRPPTNSTKI